ncbi:MAG: hypothetical protein HPY66_2552 [Firmicutes bacterium]|nr:hypothetical protein [Bacillota bacterium]
MLLFVVCFVLRVLISLELRKIQRSLKREQNFLIAQLKN